jgi:acyl-CoA thioester hydrolase
MQLADNPPGLAAYFKTAHPMKQLTREYPVVLSQEIIWGDMDAFGHINNTVYFRYFEDVRIAYFDRVGVQERMKQFGVGPILASTTCNFRLPLDYPDRIHIATRASILSAKKFNMEYVVYSEAHGAVAAEGDGLVVYYDYANEKSCEIPEEIVGAIRKLEG